MRINSFSVTGPSVTTEVKEERGSEEDGKVVKVRLKLKR